MKTYNFIESANVVIKNVGANLRSANREYTSLSRVLKDIQRADLMKAGYAHVFEALGLPTDGKITPAQLREVMHDEQFKMVKVGKGKERHEEPRLGLWGWHQKKDAEGNLVYEADGKTPVMVAELRTVGAWTPNKLFRVIAQANALKNA